MFRAVADGQELRADDRYDVREAGKDYDNATIEGYIATLTLESEDVQGQEELQDHSDEEESYVSFASAGEVDEESLERSSIGAHGRQGCLHNFKAATTDVQKNSISKSFDSIWSKREMTITAQQRSSTTGYYRQLLVLKAA